MNGSLIPQRPIHDKCIEGLLDVVRSAKIGRPTVVGDPCRTDHNASAVSQGSDYIEITKGEGARCILGGNAYDGPGARGGQFVEAPIFTGVSNKMRIAQEEIFGPVLAVIPFEDENDAIHIPNDVDFGFAAGVWTADIGCAFRMSEKLRVGTVWINIYRAVSAPAPSPFGSYKRSGLGREGEIEAIKLQVKSVWIATKPNATNPFITR